MLRSSVQSCRVACHAWDVMVVKCSKKGTLICGIDRIVEIEARRESIGDLSGHFASVRGKISSFQVLYRTLTTTIPPHNTAPIRYHYRAFSKAGQQNAESSQKAIFNPCRRARTASEFYGGEHARRAKMGTTARGIWPLKRESRSNSVKPAARGISSQRQQDIGITATQDSVPTSCSCKFVE